MLFREKISEFSSENQFDEPRRPAGRTTRGENPDTVPSSLCEDDRGMRAERPPAPVRKYGADLRFFLNLPGFPPASGGIGGIIE